MFGKGRFPGQVELKRQTSLEALADFEDASIDFVYLDADHSYEAVRDDLEAIRRVLKPGGIVMLDDYHRRGWFKDQVITAANEFIGRHAASVRIRMMRGAQLAIEML